MRALVVDDSKAIRRILTQMLVSMGFEVSEAGDGKEAFQVVESSDLFEFALVDWNMPEMNGYELVCEIRKNSKYDNMRLMMVTTETEMSQVVKALEAGANEYVMKPFTKEMIQEKLTLMGIAVNSS
ncbi:MAG: response regulator [Candidatus Nitronauta litoralis]|uniref:Response regulator n=1 Tax=Candidatus Nitronauta litoralis TaxID=2705533 RepID=A0A7T0G0X3_9BACT|nr:MAG: response regulator [Candidatus Nitronauta litoralis]